MEAEEQGGPSSKRQRLPHITPPAATGADAGAAAGGAGVSARQHTPCVTSLFQVPAGLPHEPSPGAMHACRIAAWHDPQDGSSSTYGSLLASGRHLFWSQCYVQQQQLQPEQHGKEGVLLPLRLQTPAVTQLQQLPHHAGEVQSLALCGCPTSQYPNQLLLATVDAYGAGSIAQLRPVSEYTPVSPPPSATAAAAGSTNGGTASSSQSASALAASEGPEVVVQSVLQPMHPCREGGWAGVAFSGSNAAAAAAPALLATARCFAKDICVYDVPTGKALRSLACVQNPYALTFLPPGVLGGSSSDKNLLAVAEGHLVAVWDVRAGSCAQRFSPGALGQPLYTLAWSAAQGGLLGTAGAERNLYLCEPRKWRTVSKWHGATRLAIHSVSFLDCDPRCAVLAGLDLEVVVGRWDSPGSNARVFESGRKQDGDEAAAIAGAAGAAGGSRGQVDAAAAAAAGGSSLAPKHAAQGAHGSGDGSRRSGGQKAGAAGGGGGMDLDDGEGPSAASAGALTFRGDGRWLGVSKAVGADVLAGFAASGNLVYARLA